MRSECDLVICGEPYTALLMWLDTGMNVYSRYFYSTFYMSRVRYTQYFYFGRRHEVNGSWQNDLRGRRMGGPLCPEQVQTMAV